MKHSNPYLFFNGNCEAAMTSYQKIFGGELKLTKVEDVKHEMFKSMDQSQVMHGLLKTSVMQIMASDNLSKDQTIGDNVCVYLECSSKAEVDQLFAALSKDGEESMKPEDTFWGAYFGSLTDAFGVSWMLSFQH